MKVCGSFAVHARATVTEGALGAQGAMRNRKRFVDFKQHVNFLPSSQLVDFKRFPPPA